MRQVSVLPAWLTLSRQQQGAVQVSASPRMRLPGQAVTPGHSNHTGSFTCWHVLLTISGQGCFNPELLP